MPRTKREMCGTCGGAGFVGGAWYDGLKNAAIGAVKSAAEMAKDKLTEKAKEHLSWAAQKAREEATHRLGQYRDRATKLYEDKVTGPHGILSKATQEARKFKGGADELEDDGFYDYDYPPRSAPDYPPSVPAYPPSAPFQYEEEEEDEIPEGYDDFFEYESPEGQTLPAAPSAVALPGISREKPAFLPPVEARGPQRISAAVLASRKRDANKEAFDEQQAKRAKIHGGQLGEYAEKAFSKIPLVGQIPGAPKVAGTLADLSANKLISWEKERAERVANAHREVKELNEANAKKYRDAEAAAEKGFQDNQKAYKENNEKGHAAFTARAAERSGRTVDEYRAALTGRGENQKKPKRTRSGGLNAKLKERNDVVRKIMHEHGLQLAAASKYLAEHPEIWHK